MGRGDCFRCVVGDAQILPATLKIRGARAAWYCRLAIDTPRTNEQLAATYVVLVRRAGTASVTDVADVQRRALRSAEWRRFTAANGPDPRLEAHVLRVIALAYPQSVEMLRREVARGAAQV
jgi:hypothetical protein